MIAGIDYSTKFVDVVLLDEDMDAAHWHRFPLVGLGDAFDRARMVRAAMPPRSWWEDMGVVAVGIEDPRGYAAGHLYRVQGGILQCLPRDLLVQPWIPSVWRKAVGLPGNAPKGDVAERGRELLAVAVGFNAAVVVGDVGAGVFDLVPWPQDAYDALCIAHATRSVVELGEAA